MALNDEKDVAAGKALFAALQKIVAMDELPDGEHSIAFIVAGHKVHHTELTQSDRVLHTYLIHGESDDEPNDWFVSANTPRRAVELWREFLGTTIRSTRRSSA